MHPHTARNRCPAVTAIAVVVTIVTIVTIATIKSPPSASLHPVMSSLHHFPCSRTNKWGAPTHYSVAIILPALLHHPRELSRTIRATLQHLPALLWQRCNSTGTLTHRRES
jgi:hypothetical protein